MNQKPLVGFGSQFALLIGLFGVSLILSSFLMGLISAEILNKPLLQAGSELLKPENANLARVLNTVATFISFFIPAWVVAKVSNANPFNSLGFSKYLSIKQIGIVVFITVAALFLSGSLAELNEKIPMPAAFIKKARELEQLYKNAMLSMATMNNIGDYLLSLLVIALAPAVFEEVFFRGGMQNILIGWTKHAWLGIILTSIIFSAIHGSYFGFLPRVGLGIVLGLVYFNSKNIWLSITMHFLNNAIIVTQMYYLTRIGKPIDKAMDESMPIWFGVFAIIGLIIFFKLFTIESGKVISKNQSTHNYELVD